MKIKVTNIQDSLGKKITLSVENGFFVSSFSGENDVEILDGQGLTVIPGLVDLHTHLRTPGMEDAEDIDSGARAANAGGYTALSAMPNTSPIADNAGVVEQIYSAGKKNGNVSIFPIGAVTVGQKGERLSEMNAMHLSQAKVRIFSDDGNCVSDSLVMRRALEYVKTFDGIIAQHAQDPRLTEKAQIHEGLISARLGLKGWPAVAEEAIIARDVLIASHVESRLHICHVTTAGGVEIIRWAKERGFPVTAEVTPHHLLLTDSETLSFDPKFKVNPPLRSESDVRALREGLADGTIDIVATDHAPHQNENKDTEWDRAAFGMIGLQSSFPVSYQAMVESGLISLSELIERMAAKPASIGGYSGHGSLEPGYLANFSLVKLDTEWVFTDFVNYSKSSNSPFFGSSFSVLIEETFFQGRSVFSRKANLQ